MKQGKRIRAVRMGMNRDCAGKTGFGISNGLFLLQRFLRCGIRAKSMPEARNGWERMTNL